jgi:N-acetylglucosamine kinase-like BadF-type ATPase
VPQLSAVAVGAAGMATLGDGLRAELPGALAAELGVRRLALAADGVTAYAGALGQRPGAVVAAGTGMIALGTDLGTWRRADGWGHLLGDCGGGAWIGRAGLDAAMRAYDGRRGGSAALLALAEERFGPVAGLPARIYPRTDRPAVLASFAPDVARAALDDSVAAGILREAAAHIAEAAAVKWRSRAACSRWASRCSPRSVPSSRTNSRTPKPCRRPATPCTVRW